MPRGPNFLSAGDLCTITQWIRRRGVAMRGSGAWAVVVCAVGPAVAGVSCSKGAPSSPTYYARETLLDPDTCKQCHADHYADWSSSMHAYASDDPVFRAMNQRGQRETNGALGGFCVKCHAPMAVNEGATTDGLNLDTVPQSLHGVTCFFCHSVDAVNGTHNDPLALSTRDHDARRVLGPGRQRRAPGGLLGAPRSRRQLASAPLCGACHDIVSPAGRGDRADLRGLAGVALLARGRGETRARSATWRSSRRRRPRADRAGAERLRARSTTCTRSSPSTADDADASRAPPRASTPLCRSSSNTTFQTALCVVQQDGTGPSASSSTTSPRATRSRAARRRTGGSGRRSIAYRRGKVIYQSGVVPAGHAGDVAHDRSDPDFGSIRDCMFDDAGAQVNMFWQAASVESNLIPFPTTSNATDPAFLPNARRAVLPARPDGDVAGGARQGDAAAALSADRARRAPGPRELRRSRRSVAGEVPTLVFPEPILTWTAATANGSYLEGINPVSCITDTGLNVAADKNPAVNHARCSP